MGGVDFTPRQMSPYGDEHPPVCSSTGTHDISSNNMMKKMAIAYRSQRKRGKKTVKGVLQQMLALLFNLLLSRFKRSCPHFHSSQCHQNNRKDGQLTLHNLLALYH